MLTSGNRILDLCQKAQRSVFIASPFIKFGALRKITSVLPTMVELVVISRFRPEDVQSGVCDLAAVEALWGRQNTQVLLHPMLHAKLYIIDDIAFSGSANLTDRGMGWSPSSNIEILIEIKSDHENVNYTRNYLMHNSIKFTMPYFEYLSKYRLKKAIEYVDETIWIPECLEPEYLWDIFQQKRKDAIISTTYDAGLRDIEYSGVASLQLFDKSMFLCVVKTAFLQSEFYKLFHEKLADKSLSDEAAVEFITSLNSPNTNTPNDKWRAVKAWIRVFCDDLIIETQSEVVSRKKLF
jgi:hypothetical protein